MLENVFGPDLVAALGERRRAGRLQRRPWMTHGGMTSDDIAAAVRSGDLVPLAHLYAVAVDIGWIVAGDATWRRFLTIAHVAATHPVFCGPAIERIEDSPITQITVTDTVPLSEEARKCSKIRVLSVVSLLGEAIRRIHRDESVSSLFNDTRAYPAIVV